MSKRIIGTVLKWMLTYLTDNQVNCSNDNHERAVNAVAHAYQDNWPDFHRTGLDWSDLRRHGHAAATTLKENKHMKKKSETTTKEKGGAPVKKVNIQKIQNLSNEELKQMIEVRAGKKSMLLRHLVKEWNARQRKPWTPNPDTVIKQFLVLVPDEKKNRVEKYMRNAIK